MASKALPKEKIKLTSEQSISALTNKDELVGRLDLLFDSTSRARQRFDRDWYIYDNFVRGNHYLLFNRETNRIETPPKPKGRVRVTINKVYATLRAVRNFVTRFKPKWNVDPYGEREERHEEARFAEKFLDYLYDKINMERVNKDVTFYGLKYSRGWYMVWFDEEMDEIRVDSVDPFDLYVDPGCTNPITLEDAGFVFLTIRKSLAEIRHNPDYEDVDKVMPDEKQAESRWKDMTIKRNASKVDTTSVVPELGAAILRVGYFLEEEENERGGKIRKIVYSGKTILQDTPTEMTEYPIVGYASDVNPKELYSEGWVKNLIPLNKLLNRLASLEAEFSMKLSKGKWITEKGSGVRFIDNVSGEIIEKNRGYQLEQARLATIPPHVFRQEENTNRYIEDIGGYHEVSVGRIPTGAKSGRAIEALAQGDANNLSDLRENLEISLEVLGEKILKLAARHYTNTRLIEITGSKGNKEEFRVIGEEATNRPEEVNGQKVAILSGKHRVKVSIGSWLAHTREARQDYLMELYSKKVIDQQTLLEHLEFGEVQEVMKRTQEAQQQGEDGEGGAGAEMYKLAGHENLAMAKGQRVPPTIGATPRHTELHVAFMNTPQFRQLPPEVDQLFEEHAMEEINQHGG